MPSTSTRREDWHKQPEYGICERCQLSHAIFFLKLTKRMAKVRHAHILTRSILALNQSPQTRNCVQETARSHAYARFLRARATYHFISRPRSQTDP